MLLWNVAPWVLDLITFGIMAIGLILGIFFGLRSLLFVTIGDGLGIGLAFAFKSLTLSSFSNFIYNNIGSNFNPEAMGRLVADNLANSLYFLIWILGFNLIFWILYLIFKYTFLKKYPIKHKIVNRSAGAIVNTLRMSFVSAFFILFMGTGIISTAAKVNNQYYDSHEVADKSIAYKFFSKIEPDFPFFNIKSSSIIQINDLKNYSFIFSNTGIAIENEVNKGYSESTKLNLKNAVVQLNEVVPLTTDENNYIEQQINSINNNISLATSVLNIRDKLLEHIHNDFLDTSFMQPLLNALSDFINRYPDISQIFTNDVNKLVEQIGQVEGLQKGSTLYTSIVNFINGVPGDQQAKLKDAFNKLYEGNLF